MSWSSRYAQRGGMSLGAFLAELKAQGFVEEWARPGHTYEFSHPDAGNWIFVVRSESFANAAARLMSELQTQREYEGTG
jgi:hypothetical protein